jgi:hypothetical protein
VGGLHRAVLAVVATALGIAAAAPAPRAAAGENRPKHVFIVILENESYPTTFGPNSPAPYLSRELTKQGLLLTNYYAIGHASLDNYIAMVSGQPPNHQTQADCFRFTKFSGYAGLSADGIAGGSGCIYPEAVQTIADQLERAHLTWGGYMEDMGNGQTLDETTCRRPQPDTIDCTFMARAKDQYAARHNPFIYFDSLINDGSCERHDVPLDRLSRDLQRVETTPNLVFITPNLCNDAHDPVMHSNHYQTVIRSEENACPKREYPDTSRTCANGDPGGLVSADGFLKRWIPLIESSPAFKQDGMLIITFDEAATRGSEADSRACCGERPGPDPEAQQPGGNGPGGGIVGAVIIAPKFVRVGEDGRQYNHYALLKSLEDLFRLRPYLGLAAQPDVPAFGGDVYRNP